MKIMGLEENTNNNTQHSLAKPSAQKSARTGRIRRWLPAAHGIPHMLPWSRGIARVAAVTKIVCLIALSTVTLLKPHWSAVVTIGFVLLLGSLSARLPICALPVFPIWAWSGIFGAMVGAWLGGELVLLLRSLAVTAIVAWGSFLLLWTTRLEDIAPAFRMLLSPLRLFRLPVDQWTQTMSFAFRGLGPMQDQTAAVADATKLRLGSIENMRKITFKQSIRLMLDTATASLSAASRRSADTGRALTLRGGVPQPHASTNAPRFGWRDGLTLLMTAIACTVPFITPLLHQAWTALVG